MIDICFIGDMEIMTFPEYWSEIIIIHYCFVLSLLLQIVKFKASLFNRKEKGFALGIL